MQPRYFCKILCLFAIICQLQACTDVAMSSAQVVVNRHSLQKNLNDQYLTMQAFKAIEIRDTRFRNAHVVIATFNGEMLLTGQVPEPWQKTTAEEIVKRQTGVNTVYNFIAVGDPSSTLTRMSDAWLTTKIKAKFAASDDLESNQIKVLTENGTVYLMGIIPPAEAEAAVDIARHTQGVTSVVKIFSYIHISKNQRA